MITTGRCTLVKRLSLDSRDRWYDDGRSKNWKSCKIFPSKITFQHEFRHHRSASTRSTKEKAKSRHRQAPEKIPINFIRSKTFHQFLGQRGSSLEYFELIFVLLLCERRVHLILTQFNYLVRPVCILSRGNNHNFSIVHPSDQRECMPQSTEEVIAQSRAQRREMPAQRRAAMPNSKWFISN